MKEHKIITYLSFNGDCEDAVNTYIDAFGGEIFFLSRWTEETCEKESQIGKIMHMRFRLGETLMAAGDDYEGETFGAMKLLIDMETEGTARKSIEILKKGGEVLSELSPHPEPDDGGMGCVLVDKYGVKWIITCPDPRKQAIL